MKATEVSNCLSGQLLLFFGYKAHGFFKKNLSSGGKLVLKLGSQFEKNLQLNNTRKGH